MPAAVLTKQDQATLQQQAAVDYLDAFGWIKRNCWVVHPATNRAAPVELTPEQEEFIQNSTKRRKTYAQATSPPDPLSTGGDGENGRGAPRGEALFPFARKTVVACWPKRCGKSLCIQLIIVWRMCCFRGQHGGLIANSERQAQGVLFKGICKIFKHSPNLAVYVTDDDINRGRISIPEFENLLECYPDNEETIQGEQFNFIGSDELHASSTGGRTFQWASAQTEPFDAQVYVSSQAGEPVEGNPIYKLSRDRSGSVYFDYRTMPFTAWAIALAEEFRSKVPPALWRVMFRNAWGTAGNTLLEPDDVMAAALGYRIPKTAQEWQELRASWGFGGRSYTLGVGLDRAGVSVTGDRSVIAVVARFEITSPPGPLSTGGEGEHGELLLDAPEPEIWDDQMAGETPAPREDEAGDELADLIADNGAWAANGACYRVVWLWVMPTGSARELAIAKARIEEIFGEPTQGLFESPNTDDIIGLFPWAEQFPATVKNNAAKYTGLWRLVKERRFGFPELAGVDPKTRAGGLLKHELLSFGWAVLSSAKVKWKTQRGHDDAFDAVSMACLAAAPGIAEPEDQYEIVTMSNYVKGWEEEKIGAARV